MVKSKLKLRVLGNRILVRPFLDEDVKDGKTKTGIILPDHVAEVKKKPTRGQVIEVGPEVTKIKKGEWVRFEKYASNPISIDGVDLYFFDEDQILAVEEQ